MRLLLWLGVLLSVSCDGVITGARLQPGVLSPEAAQPQPQPNPLPQPQPDPVQPEPKPIVTPTSRLRRLNPRELDASLAMLTGETHGHAAALLPNPAASPFDNVVEGQLPSAAWVEGVEQLANQVATETFADPARRAKVMPCTPTGNADLACLSQFIRSFGRQVLRRPLTDAEVTRFGSLHAQALQRGSIDTSLRLAMVRLLVDPEFHFRVELGSAVTNGVMTLTEFEVASRLAFALQGRAPPAWLLAKAEAGELHGTEALQVAARRLLDEPAGRAMVERFHALWLGYATLPNDAQLNERLFTETTALVRRVVFEQPGDYRRLFTSQETFVDAALASHYGLTAPATTGFGWAPYQATGRQGVLSHGAVLANGTKNGETSPTLRGLWIRRRLFCQEIPPPPPNVVMDLPPPMQGAAVCKKERLSAHSTNGSCAGCHHLMDPVGFGLERFDSTGKFRTAEPAFPQCSIDGQGELAGVGSFNGPAELASLMISSGALEPCVVKQVFRFAYGRTEQDEDEGWLAAVERSFTSSGRRFDELLVAMTTDEQFSKRRVEVTP